MHQLKKYRYLFFIVIVFQIAATSTALAQQKLRVIILRHAEKPDQGDNLSCTGLNRALKLPAVINAKFGVPNYAYVPAPAVGKATKSLRMLQTISPLAVKYNLTLNTNYEVDDTKKLAANILKKSGTVIVVWEHNNIPDIISALGVDTKKLKWRGDDFDSLWIVTVNGQKTQLTQDEQGIHPASGCPF